MQPHRTRLFRLSNDPQFASRRREIVGLYVEPSAHTVVLSIDEKSQIQVVDLTQPRLLLKKRPCGTMTHDYIRNGTPTLFAALNVLDGKVIGQSVQQHRHQEFIRFLNTVKAAVPAGKLIHTIADNCAIHRHPKVREWLARHPRWTLHFAPISASWLSAVEGYFTGLTRRRLKRRVFRSIVQLQVASNRSLAKTNADPRPFRWTKDPTKSSQQSKKGSKC